MEGPSTASRAPAVDPGGAGAGDPYGRGGGAAGEAQGAERSGGRAVAAGPAGGGAGGGGEGSGGAPRRTRLLACCFRAKVSPPP